MRYLILPLLLCLSWSCSHETPSSVRASPSTTERETQPTRPPTDTTTTPRPSNPTPPKDVTAMDQTNVPADVDVTQRVRQALVNDSTLSVAGKNVTVVSKNGTVSLRGTVATSDEKARIKSLVMGVDGVREVDDQIEIKP